MQYRKSEEKCYDIISRILQAFFVEACRSCGAYLKYCYFLLGHRKETYT